MGAAAVFVVKSVGGDSRDLSKQDQSLVTEVATLKSQLFSYENLGGKIISVNKEGLCIIAAEGPLGAICPLPCLLAQAILTRKLTN